MASAGRFVGRRLTDCQRRSVWKSGLGVRIEEMKNRANSSEAGGGPEELGLESLPD